MADETATREQLEKAFEFVLQKIEATERRLSATNLALVFALDEATRDLPERQDLLARVVSRLEAPGADYSRAEPGEQSYMLHVEADAARLADLMRQFWGIGGARPQTG
jgi:hypothetical protein